MSRGIVAADGPRPAPVLRLAAGIALLVVIAGIPLWLVRHGGSPWVHLDPRSMWTGFGVHRSVDAGRAVRWAGHVALAVAWVAWAWSVVCLVVELRAWTSGRAAVRLPASRSLQWGAALLIGTTFAIGAVGRASSPARVVPPAVSRSTVTVPGSEGRALADSGARVRTTEADHPDGGSLQPATPGGRTVVLTRSVASTQSTVSPLRPSDHTHDDPDPPASLPRVLAHHSVTSRETLWSIAETRLGSARRWPEIAVLNYGRRQPDGRALGEDHWIRAGWQLELPVDTDTNSTAEPDGALRPPVAGGHTGRDGTEVQQGLPAVHDEVSRSPGDTPHDMVLTDVVPAMGHRDAVRESLPRGPGIPVPPATPLGAGVVGAGLAGMVDRLRRVQQRHRAEGLRIGMPEPALREFEQRVRCGDGADILWAAEFAVRMLHDPEGVHGGMGTAAPPIVGIVVADDLVRIVLADQPSPDRDPGEPGAADGSPVLTIDRSELERWAAAFAGTRRTFPVPTLVTVGRGSDGSVVMVHPEGLGALVVRGEVPEVDGVARALALELATSRWSGQFELVLVGFGVELARFDHVSSVQDVDALATDLIRRRLRAESRLEERGLASATAARCAEPGGDWGAVVVICGPQVPVDDSEALLALGGDGRWGIAVVAVAPHGPGPRGPARSVLAGPDRNGALLEYLGQLVEPQSIGAKDVVDAQALLDAVGIDAPAPTAAGTPEGSTDRAGVSVTAAFVEREPSSTVRVSVEPVALEVPGETTRPEIAGEAAHPHRPPAEPKVPESRLPGGPSPRSDVEVRVLGPVEVLGAARSFTRAWALELVVYLAVHPQGASNETWATALWPDRVMAPSSLHSTVSVARRALGTSRGGDDHLPRSHGRLALASSVGTDWGRFLDLSRTDDVDQWREALELVRGRPFEGLRSADWSILDGTAPAIESAVVDLSGRLSGASLRIGDARGAEWAARRGLLVSPYDERLYRMLMRAADAAGNPGGVESAMSDLMRVVADEIEPVESVHPSTLALYRSLTRRRIPVA